jgi:hypothetical protein
MEHCMVCSTLGIRGLIWAAAGHKFNYLN